MITQGDDPVVQVSESTLPVDELVASFQGYADLEHNLQTATVLIVPTDLCPEYMGPAFPQSTRDVFFILREKLGDRASVEAAVREEDYVEFAFRSDEIILPIVYLASHVLIPLAISILGSFLYDRLKDRRRIEGAKVKSEVHFKTRDGSQLFLKYEGPVDTFERVTMQHLRGLGLLPDEIEDLEDGSTDGA